MELPAQYAQIASYKIWCNILIICNFLSHALFIECIIYRNGVELELKPLRLIVLIKKWRIPVIKGVFLDARAGSVRLADYDVCLWLFLVIFYTIFKWFMYPEPNWTA